MDPVLEVVSIKGHELQMHTWRPAPSTSSSSRPRGVAVVYHGGLAHGLYPTVRYASEMLVRAGYVVYAADMPGHGQSPGLKGLLPDADTVVQLGVGIAEYALQQQQTAKEDSQSHDAPALFLIGSSMGGTIALAVARKLQEQQHVITSGEATGSDGSGRTSGSPVAGVVLLAPMLKLRVGEVERYLLNGLSMVIPTWEVIPTNASSSEHQYRDAAKRQECESDPYKNTTGKLRIQTVQTCVELCRSAQAAFSQTDVPFLVMVANDDVVVDSQGSLDLFDQSPSKDKELKRYDALHGLLCEPPPLIETIQNDFLQWIEARTHSKT